MFCISVLKLFVTHSVEEKGRILLMQTLRKGKCTTRGCRVRVRKSSSLGNFQSLNYICAFAEAQSHYAFILVSDASPSCLRMLTWTGGAGDC